jgi:hypothetical protein
MIIAHRVFKISINLYKSSLKGRFPYMILIEIDLFFGNPLKLYGIKLGIHNSVTRPVSVPMWNCFSICSNLLPVLQTGSLYVRLAFAGQAGVIRH